MSLNYEDDYTHALNEQPGNIFSLVLVILGQFGTLPQFEMGQMTSEI